MATMHKKRDYSVLRKAGGAAVALAIAANAVAATAAPLDPSPVVAKTASNIAHLIDKAPQGRDVFLGDGNHEELSVTEAALSPEVFKSLARHGIKEFFLEVPQELQGAADALQQDPIKNRDAFIEKMRGSYTSVHEDQQKYMETLARAISSAKQNNIHVDFIDTMYTDNLPQCVKGKLEQKGGLYQEFADQTDYIANGEKRFDYLRKAMTANGVDSADMHAASHYFNVNGNIVSGFDNKNGTDVRSAIDQFVKIDCRLESENSRVSNIRKLQEKGPVAGFFGAHHFDRNDQQALIQKIDPHQKATTVYISNKPADKKNYKYSAWASVDTPSIQIMDQKNFAGYKHQPVKPALKL